METNRNNRQTGETMKENEYIIGQSTINTMHGKMVLNAIEDEDKMSLSYTNLKRNCYTYKNGKAYLWVKPLRLSGNLVNIPIETEETIEDF